MDVTYFLGGEAQALAFEVADTKYSRRLHIEATFLFCQEVKLRVRKRQRVLLA